MAVAEKRPQSFLNFLAGQRRRVHFLPRRAEINQVIKCDIADMELRPLQKERLQTVQFSLVFLNDARVYPLRTFIGKEQFNSPWDGFDIVFCYLFWAVTRRKLRL